MDKGRKLERRLKNGHLRQRIKSLQALKDTDLSHVADEIMECEELEQWGRYIRAEKPPGPPSAPGAPSIFSLAGHRTDEDDLPEEGDYNPDFCESISNIVMQAPDICQRVLFAYYCQWPGSIRKCSKFMQSSAHDSKARLSEREFSLKIGFAQGLVMSAIKKAA